MNIGNEAFVVLTPALEAVEIDFHTSAPMLSNFRVAILSKTQLVSHVLFHPVVNYSTCNYVRCLMFVLHRHQSACTTEPLSASAFTRLTFRPSVQPLT